MFADDDQVNDITYQVHFLACYHLQYHFIFVEYSSLYKFLSVIYGSMNFCAIEIVFRVQYMFYMYF